MTAHVLVTRLPGGNTYTVDGDVTVTDLDLSAAFHDRPGDYETAMGFALSVIRLDNLPVDSPVFDNALDVYRGALCDWPQVLPVIDEYEADRRRAP